MGGAAAGRELFMLNDRADGRHRDRWNPASVVPS